MEEDFRSLLTGSVSVVALVPPGSINWSEHPQGRAFPGIVLHLINSSDGYTVSDVLDLASVRVQVNCLGTTYAQAKAISRAVRALLSGYQSGPFYQVRVSETASRDSGMRLPDEPKLLILDCAFDYRRT